MRLIDDCILRKVHGNAVLVPPPEKDIGFNGMIVLNNTGEFVCKLLEKDTDKEALAAALAKEYGKRPDEVFEDLEKFLIQLDSCNMLVK